MLFSIFSIQIGAALAIKLFPILGPLGTVFCRVGLSAILLLVLIRPRFDKAVLRHGHLLLLYGFTLGVMNWCFYEAIARIPLGIAVTIEFLGPLGVAVATSRRRIDLLWVAIALLGLMLLAPDFGDELDRTGVSFALIAAVGWAAFIVLSKCVGQVFPGNDSLAYGMVIATLFLLPFGGDAALPALSHFWILRKRHVSGTASPEVQLIRRLAASSRA